MSGKNITGISILPKLIRIVIVGQAFEGTDLTHLLPSGFFEDRAPETLPSIVYRVDYAGSQTSFSSEYGFRAKNQRTIIDNTKELRTFASAHFNWASNVSSPFISVFADKHHAELWARGFSMRNNGKECFVIAINTTCLGRGPIFRAADLFAAGVESPMDEMQHYSEYLILYRIPMAALIDETKVSQSE